MRKKSYEETLTLDQVENKLNRIERKDGFSVTRQRIIPGDGDHRHGTLNGYQNLGCRCPECREAGNAASRKRDRANRAWK